MLSVMVTPAVLGPGCVPDRGLVKSKSTTLDDEAARRRIVWHLGTTVKAGPRHGGRGRAASSVRVQFPVRTAWPNPDPTLPGSRIGGA
jgi:hypothetical protein